MADDVVEIHAIVTGDVQGVGFRFITERIARGLGISGTVKNLKDGSVELYAAGPRSLLDELLEKLKVGAGRVDDISVEVSAPIQEFDGFKIIF